MLSQHFDEIFKCLNDVDIVDVFAKRRPVDKVKNFNLFNYVQTTKAKCATKTSNVCLCRNLEILNRCKCIACNQICSRMYQ